MTRWIITLLLASPHLRRRSRTRLSHRTGSITCLPVLRFASQRPVCMAGSSVDLLAITSAARIADDFMPADLLLIGGLVPGTSKVEFGAQGRAALVIAIHTRDWFISASVEAGSHAAVNFPVTAANLLRIGNVLENAPIDTRNLFARGLVTREIGLAIAMRHELDGITFEVGAAARHVSPVAFANGRVDALSDEPALVVDNGNLSAHADFVYSSGHADGSGVGDVR